MKMRIIALVLATFISFSVSIAQKITNEDQKSYGIEKIINSQWTFNYFPYESANQGYESPGFNDSKWPAVSLPHTWSTYETTGELYPSVTSTSENNNPYWWIGWGWYRKHFAINSNFSDMKVFIEFEGVQKYCKVWINGKYLGDNKGGEGSFDFDITDLIITGKDNVLAVAVNNNQENGVGVSPGTKDDFNLYGGIVGNVRLRLKNKLYFLMKGSSDHDGGLLITTPLVSEKEAVARVQGWIKNESKEKKSCSLQTTISDSNDKIIQVIKSNVIINPGQVINFDQTSKPVRKPHLWKKTDPYIYKVYTEVIDGKEVADSYFYPDGLRFTGEKDIILPATIHPEQDGFEDLFVNKVNETSVSPKQKFNSGEAARIVLTSSGKIIKADRGTVIILSADIVDSDGVHVTEPEKTIKWFVSGPAKLVGPSTFISVSSNKDQVNEGWYGDMPVSNAIRSTGTPGKIVVTVSTTGLASGLFEIQAEEMKADNSVIIEPPLEDEGRKQVDRPVFTVDRLNDLPQEIQITGEDIEFGKTGRNGFKDLIRDFIMKRNPEVDSSLIEFKVLIDLFAVQLFNNNGRISADDFNFTIGHYNNCRLISGYITATRLPPLFKDGLRSYYAELVIRQGSEKNAGEEMNWLNWIPSGGTVVISADGKGESYPKGTKVTSSRELPDLIALVYPVYNTFSDEAKERALIFISKMNPYIMVSNLFEERQDGNKEDIIKSIYLAEKDRPILIPDLKFISE